MSVEGKEKSNEYLPTATLTFNEQPQTYEILKSLVKQKNNQAEIHNLKVFWFKLFYIMSKRFLDCPDLTNLQITECSPR